MSDDLFKWLGLIGGCSISASLVPQLWKTLATRSTADLAWSWQIIYIFGLSLALAYALKFNLWPMYVPGIFEQLCIMWLTWLKFYYEVLGYGPKQEASSDGMPRGQDGSGSSTPISETKSTDSNHVMMPDSEVVVESNRMHHST